MKKRRSIRFIVLLFAVFFILTLSAHATLQLRGTDSLGNRLIYDNDLDITWYDYTRSWDTWDNQVAWADALAVTFGSNTYTDWRLPLTVDGPYVWGYDGNTTAGYNITNSEMGHLFYLELGNRGYLATNGTYPQPGWGLINTGDFLNLQPNYYWSSTEYATDPDYAWYFMANVGSQELNYKGFGSVGNVGAIAVRAGDVAVVPEPMSMILFGAGGVVMAARRMAIRRRG